MKTGIESGWYRTSLVQLLVFLFALSPGPAYSDIRPEKVYVADAKKTMAYIKDGLIVGGDKAIDDVIIKDIRRAANPGYERIVIDLQGTLNGESAEIQRAPYFQFAVSPDERRLVATLWGHPKLQFDSKKVIAAFKRSSVIQDVMLLPRLEDHSWTFALELKTNSPVEVFELAQPVRVIVDIRRMVEHKIVKRSKPKELE